MNSQTPNDLVSIEEASEILCVSRNTLANWRTRKSFPLKSHKTENQGSTKKKIFYSRSELLKFKTNRTAGRISLTHERPELDKTTLSYHLLTKAWTPAAMAGALL